MVENRLLTESRDDGLRGPLRARRPKLPDARPGGRSGSDISGDVAGVDALPPEEKVVLTLEAECGGDREEVLRSQKRAARVSTGSSVALRMRGKVSNRRWLVSAGGGAGGVPRANGMIFMRILERGLSEPLVVDTLEERSELN